MIVSVIDYNITIKELEMNKITTQDWLRIIVSYGILLSLCFLIGYSYGIKLTLILFIPFSLLLTVPIIISDSHNDDN